MSKKRKQSAFASQFSTYQHSNGIRFGLLPQIVFSNLTSFTWLQNSWHILLYIFSALGHFLLPKHSQSSSQGSEDRTLPLARWLPSLRKAVLSGQHSVLSPMVCLYHQGLLHSWTVASVLEKQNKTILHSLHISFCIQDMLPHREIRAMGVYFKYACTQRCMKDVNSSCTLIQVPSSSA